MTHQADGPAAAPPTLRDWLAVNGPLAAPIAILLALRVCARASSMADEALRAGIGSLDAGHVRREPTGGWQWVPRATPAPRRTAGDADVLEQVGALLFECLTAQPAPRSGGEAATVARLRTLRPDLSPSVADLVAGALVARDLATNSLDAFARELRTALGAGGRQARRWRGTGWLVGVAAAVFVVAGWRLVAPDDEAGRLGSNGFTMGETADHDVLRERADHDTVIDEHTFAVQSLQQLDRLFQARLAANDPRVWWNLAREAWVRRLAGDPITTEQYLSPAPAILSRALGESHPYTRVARLALADTLAARGDTATAERLRSEAAGRLRELVPEAALRPDDEGTPWPIHVVAHVAPNAPAPEGFRESGGGGFAHLFTSTQRWLAGRDGWMLHVRATGECRVAAVVGADPRGIAVAARRADDGTWAARVDGTVPPLVASGPPGPSFAVTLAGESVGRISLRLADDGIRQARLDPDAGAPVPPYAVEFSGAPGGSGCAVVWLEIEPTQRR